MDEKLGANSIGGPKRNDQLEMADRNEEEKNVDDATEIGDPQIGADNREDRMEQDNNSKNSRSYWLLLFRQS